MKLVSIVASTRAGSVNRALYENVAPRLERAGHVLEEIDHTLIEDLAPYIPRSLRPIGRARCRR